MKKPWSFLQGGVHSPASLGAQVALQHCPILQTIRNNTQERQRMQASAAVSLPHSGQRMYKTPSSVLARRSLGRSPLLVGASARARRRRLGFDLWGFGEDSIGFARQGPRLRGGALPSASQSK